MYEERTYRGRVAGDGLVKCSAVVMESDLCVLAGSDESERALSLIREARGAIEGYILRDRSFRSALAPHSLLSEAPVIARRMAEAAARFGVGPMAAVAGAVAEHVGGGIEGDVIVENGGDIYARRSVPVTVDLYAGERSKFTGSVRFAVDPGGTAVGIATSSGTVGPSLSFGRADAVCVVSESAPDADAAATAFCNMVRGEEDVERVIEQAMAHERVRGIIVAIGDKLGAAGTIEFV